MAKLGFKGQGSSRMATIEMYFNLATFITLINGYVQVFLHKLTNLHFLIVTALDSQRAGGPSPCQVIRQAFRGLRALWHSLLD